MENIYGLTGAGQTSLIRPSLSGDFAAAAASSSQIDLSWTDADDPEEIEIQRSLTDGDYVKIARVHPAVETYADEGLEAETEYFYRIRFYKHGKWSDFEKASDTTTA